MQLIKICLAPCTINTFCKYLIANYSLGIET